MKKILLLLTTFLLPSSFCIAQDHHHHHHDRNEIGLSGGIMYAFDHEKWGGGVHLHYYRTLSDHSRWSVGAMAERAWVDGGHTTVGAGMKYQFTERLSVGLLPGVTFMKHEHHVEHDGHSHEHKENKTRFALHGELAYDMFHWDNFHLGPAIDFSWSTDDSHAMLGVHGAFCF